MRNKTRLLKIKYRWLGNMHVVLLLALFWNRRPLMYSAVFQPSTLMHQLHLGALMFMLLSALLWLENTWFITPLPWTRQTLFCFWSVNRSLFFVSLVFCVIMTRILRLRFFSRSRKLPRCHALCEPLSPSPLMTPWPGRNSRSGVRASLNTFCSSSLCSV